MDVQQDIDEFFESVAALIQRIDDLTEGFRKVLLLVLIDTLAKCAFPKERSNRDRFVRLVDRYSGWEHKDYVSLPQLLYLLNETAECEDLKREVERRISKWPNDRILRPHEADLPVDVLAQFGTRRCKKWIEKARYASLLWAMRNTLIHEFRTPGKGVPISPNNSSPYYHGLLDEQQQRLSWELYVPAEVISGLVQSCSDNLKKDFKQGNQNPWDSFNSASCWFPT